MAWSDEEMLAFVADERQHSIGFDDNNNAELRADRELALNYAKGVMTDIPSLPNRSTAVSTDVADTIETWLSDMVEILAGGEDVVTFRPNGAEDEKAARQETDYVNHVFFNENDGFMILYSMLKDAGQVKTGVVTWWEEDVPAPEPKQYFGQTMAEVGMVANEAEISNVRQSEQVGPEPLFDFDIIPKPRKRVRVDAVLPSDFAVAADTKKLKDTTYCAMKTRPRAQDLIADGVDAAIVADLPPFTAFTDTENLARDTAGEHSFGSTGNGIGDLRQVEVVKHLIRLVGADGVAKIWQLRTGKDETVLIDRKEVDEINFAAITPYPVPHRFYGLSVADKAMQPQKIKTSLTRMALDSGYFALNQRAEVSSEQSSDDTIPDLLRNEPGMPIRSKTGNAVRGVQAGALSFDPFNALEYFSTVIEARTGVVRNAQGLNPDTLHDTMGGAAMLATAAQKRSRLMARIFAETGIKDMYVGLHAMLRRAGGMTDTIQLRNQWVDIDPTSWGQRNDMVCEVGVGSSGRQQDMAAMNAVIGMQEKAVEMQGGQTNGPLIKPANLYASAIRFSEKAGLKNPEAYWTDPTPPEGQQGQPPAPDPQAMAAQAAQQAQQQGDAAKLEIDQRKVQIDATKAQVSAQNDAQKLQLESEKLDLERQKLALQAANDAHAQELAQRKLVLDTQMAQAKLDTDSALKLAEINAKYSTSVQVATIKSEAEQFRAHADIAISSADHQHEHALAEQAHVHGLVEAVATHALAKDAPPAGDAPEASDGDAQ